MNFKKIIIDCVLRLVSINLTTTRWIKISIIDFSDKLI
jgi:hypothetical protein